MYPKILLLFLAFSLSPAVLSQPGRSEAMVSHVKNGDKVPSFSVTAINGSSFDVNSLKGKVVLLNFWATWCAPCRSEMPRLEKEIWVRYKGRGLEMVAIAREQTNQDVTAFQKSSGYSFPMASDPKREIYNRFANAGIPRNYLVGADGRVIYQTLGYTPADFDKLAKAIEKALAELRSGSE